MNKWNEEEINLLKNNLDKNLDELLSIILNKTKISIRNKIRTIKTDNNKYKTKFDEVNWEEVQEYYDNNKMWDEILKEFNINNYCLSKAVKEGLFKTRSTSESSKISNKLRPKKLSEETKKKISESRIKYLKEHPEKVPYLLNHYSKGESYPEKYFDKIFKLYELKYKKLLQISIYQLDFAFIENGINIEIDGEQHYSDKRIVESNERKDEYLKSLGWEIIRIRWSYYQKMSRDEKKNYIKKLIEYIKTKNTDKPILINKKNICMDCSKEIHKGSNRCNKCSSIKNNFKNRKVKDRPTLEKLNNDVKELGYSGTGRKYGVSDNCIRRWIEIYK